MKRLAASSIGWAKRAIRGQLIIGSAKAYQ